MPEGKKDQDYTIPNSVWYIDSYAFEDCTYLTSVTIPNSVLYIKDEAFRGCTSLSSVTIPNSLKSISGSAFNGCTSLTSIIAESDNPNFSSSEGVLFDRNMTVLIRMPEGKDSRDFIIPNAVTTIGDWAFANCISLTSMSISNSVTTIGDYAFNGCSTLDCFSSGQHVETIGNDAFNGCTNLMTFYLNSPVPPLCERPLGIDKMCTLYVPQGSVEAYKAAPYWKDFEYIIANDTSGIEEVTAGGIDASAPMEVYNLNGVKVADTLDGLPSGLYIVRQGSKIRKIAVK